MQNFVYIGETSRMSLSIVLNEIRFVWTDKLWEEMSYLTLNVNFPLVAHKLGPF